MKNIRNIFVVLCLLCSFNIVAQQETLFSLNFSNPALTPAASGSPVLKSWTTSYGTVKYLNLSIYNTSKIYHEIEKIGWIDFKSGSESINSTNSYIELPPLTFVNGGTITINYGAGSTGRKLRVQEWNGTDWDDGSFANEAVTLASSTWYQQSWEIVGTGTKILRLVLASAPPIYITNIDVTGNMGSIGVNCADTLNFGTANINNAVIKSVNVTGNYLTTNISVSTIYPYKVSTIETGSYYSSVSIPKIGGTVYVKYQPTAIGHNICPLTLSSSGALNKVIILNGEGVLLSAAKQITSFNLNGNVGVINETNKTITVTVPSITNLTVPYTPTVTVSAKATLVTTGSIYFADGVPVTYTVRAEDGTLCNYQVTVVKLSGENQIRSFSLIGKIGSIDEENKIITVTVPSNTNLSVPYTATVTVSAKATLLTAGAIYFTQDVPVTYTVRAEDGTLCDYQVTLRLATNDMLTSNDKTTVNAVNGTVIIKTPKPVTYSIFSVNGTLLEKGTSKTGETTSASTFTNGVYIVIIEGKSYKTAVK